MMQNMPFRNAEYGISQRDIRHFATQYTANYHFFLLYFFIAL